MLDEVSAVRPAAEKSTSILPLFVAVLLIPAVLGSSKTIFNDGDVSWHIATGKWILDHRSIPHMDPFSFTWAGKPWTLMEWFADVVYGLAYRFADYRGVAAVVTAALMTLHAVVYLNAKRFLRAPAAVCALILLDLAVIPMMLARPHLLTWPILALWLLLLLRAREQDHAPALGWALLLLLWANLHASFVMGLLIAAGFAFEALVTSADKARALRQWAFFGLACAVAICFNPHGIDALLYPLGFTHLKMLPLIDEWKPSNIKVTPFFFVALGITAVLTIWKRPRLHWARWLLLAGLLAMALLQARHQAMFAISAAMILPHGFTVTKSTGEASVSLRALAAGALLLVAARLLMPLEPPENEANPWKLIGAVPPELRSQPVLNGYSMGGPLILSGIRPYIDGRSDMYGDDLVLGYNRIAHGDAAEFAAAVRRWNIRWAILPGDSKLIPLLDRSPAWRLQKRDQVGSIYVRTPANT